jgi:RND family efflux transporter MFP subunit
VRAVADPSLAEELKSLRIARDAPRRHFPSWAVWLLVLLGLAGGGVLAWRALASRLMLPEVDTTTVALVSPAQGQSLLVATGYVVPQHKANIAPRIGGRVAKIFVEDGDMVKRNQVVAILEDADYRAQLSQAYADLASSKARTLRAEVDERDAQRQYDREQIVQAKGVSTPQALDAAVARLEGAKANVEASKADALSAKARVDVAKVALDNCFVRAPFDGRITQKLAEVGEIVFGAVGAGAGGNGGVASLADFGSLMVEADVSESQVAKLKPGTPAEITLDAFPERRLRAKVHEIRPRVDRAKATVTVKVEFVDSTEDVLPDMGAKVTFLSKELLQEEAKAPPQPAVSPDAVLERGSAKVVMAMEADGRVHFIPVVTGVPLGGLVSLKQGPPPGTKVVRNPAPGIESGARVKERGQ